MEMGAGGAPSGFGQAAGAERPQQDVARLALNALPARALAAWAPDQALGQLQRPLPQAAGHA